MQGAADGLRDEHGAKANLPEVRAAPGAGLGAATAAAAVALTAVGFPSLLVAVALTLAAAVPLQDAYLATTPGGLYAVLAVAVGTGSNTTFILAVQLMRLLVAVLPAPLAVRRIAAPGRRRP